MYRPCCSWLGPSTIPVRRARRRINAAAHSRSSYSSAAMICHARYTTAHVAVIRNTRDGLVKINAYRKNLPPLDCSREFIQPVLDRQLQRDAHRIAVSYFRPTDIRRWRAPIETISSENNMHIVHSCGRRINAVIIRSPIAAASTVSTNVRAPNASLVTHAVHADRTAILGLVQQFTSQVH